MNILNVKDLPRSERPRERLARLGADNLSDRELLAIVISSGNGGGYNVVQIANDLLDAFHNDLRDLVCASIEELSRVKGIGFVKACQIKASFEVMKRAASYCEEEHPVIESTDDAVRLVFPHMIYLKQEQFKVILLDSKNRLIRHETISLGSLDAALVHPREVFRPAFAAAAASIILVHNHPSGDPEPSEQDVQLTRQLCMCGELLGIEIIDHIIVGASGYASMKHRNLM